MTMGTAATPKLGTALLNETGAFRWVDDDVCAILDMERSQLLDLSLTQLFPVSVCRWPSEEDSGQTFETPFLRGGDDWLETAWLRIVVKRTTLRPDLPVMVLVEDVSREKAKAQALIEVQQRYATIINASQGPLVFLLPDGTLADCNKAAVEMAGLSKAELVGNPSWVRQWFHGDEKQAARLSFAISQARGGTQVRVVLPTPGGDGLIRDLNYSVKRIVDGTGGSVGLFIEAHDVTRTHLATAEIYETAVSELSERLKLMERGMASAADQIVWLDASGRFIEANESTTETLGYTLEQLRGMRLADLMEGASDARCHEMFEAVRRSGQERRVLSLRRMDGSFYPVELVLTYLDCQNTPIMFGIFRDANERKAMEQQLSLLSKAVDQNPRVVMMTDGSGLLQYANQAFCDTTGYALDEVLGGVPNFFNPSEMEAGILGELEKTLAAGGVWRGDVLSKTKSGEERRDYMVAFPVFDDQGRMEHIIAVKEDAALRLEQAEAQENHFDSLTGLANRAQAMMRLDEAICQASDQGMGGHVVAMVVDIDNLKKINDTLGHDAGDEIIAACGRRIAELVQAPDSVARIEGDHFLVILETVQNHGEVEALALRIMEACGRPYCLDPQEVFLTVRVGVAAYPEDGSRSHELVRKAYVAVRRVKGAGGNVYRFYTSRMDEESQDRLRMEAKLQHAVERGELQLFYHPLVTARSKRIVGAEALLRWTSPELGPVSPADFIPLAENSGLIIPFSDWILKTACQDAVGWLKNTWGPFTLAVNFSPRQFEDHRLLDKVMAILEETGFPPSALEVEVTERLLMADSKKVHSILLGMKEAGISLSIDDFGTGYSSLSYIRKYPFNRLKIDQSFVADIPHSTETQCVVTAIVDMAHALGMDVTAEGVETIEHEQRLSDIGCELLQGYRFGKPMPAASFQKLVTNLCAYPELASI